MLQSATLQEKGQSSPALRWVNLQVNAELGEGVAGTGCTSMGDRDAFEARCASAPMHRFCRFRVLPGGAVSACFAENGTDGTSPTNPTNPTVNPMAVWDTPGGKTRRGRNGYWESVYRAMLILSAQTRLPELDFFLSKVDSEFVDWPVPVAAQSKLILAGSVVALPHEYLLGYWSRKLMARIEASAGRPWEERRPQLFWRGSTSATFELAVAEEDPKDAQRQEWTTNCDRCYFHTPHRWNETRYTATNWHLHPRGRLVLLSSFAPEHIDARFGEVSWWLDEEQRESLQLLFSRKGWLAERRTDYEDHVTYKFLISLDYSDRIYWMLLTGSLVFVAESPIAHWMVPPHSAVLQPFVHYIPVRHDLGDLLGRLQWAREHDAEAAVIAQRGQTLAQHIFRHEDVLLHLHQTIVRWARLLCMA